MFGALPFILRRPWIGALMWVWVSVMSPHRLTWGFAYNLPFAMLIALATIVGMVFSRDPKHLPITPVTVVLMLLFGWMHVSLAFAMDPTESMAMWDKVFKIFLMFFVVMYLLHSKQHIQLLVAVLTVSIAFYGIKGGLFTLRLGGGERVYGPGGSFIQENNALAVAVIMTIPLLRYWQLQVQKRWQRVALLGAMMLCGISALGSQSRGALLAISAMLLFLWFKSRSKVITLVLFLAVVPLAIGFMPQSWHDRMQTITTYESDGSAMGRLDAWVGALNLAKDRPLVGGGFGIYSDHVLGRYTPSQKARSAHSIWFQYLGEHGFPGLFLFALLWFLVWRHASWIIKQCHGREGWTWAADLSRMIQVSLIGYFVGGALLQLAYYDGPFYLLIVIVLLRALVQKEITAAEGKGSQAGKLSHAQRARSGSPVAQPVRALGRPAVRGR
jgi:probable O-glycosylation ligase (exosortase A-associated)